MHTPILPPLYYLEHFKELMVTLTHHHHALLEERHLRYIQNFQHLKENAQCLLVRMINRSGPLFNKKKLEYAEIPQLESAWEALEQFGFVRPLTATDKSLFLEWLKKDELKLLLKQNQISFLASASRTTLVQLLQSPEVNIDQEVSRPHFVMLNFQDELRYLLFLYFGKFQSKLILPTLRDLGIRRSNKEARFVTKFKNLAEAQNHYFYVSLKESYKKQESCPELEVINAWPLPQLEEGKHIREELLLKFSKIYKDQQDYANALEVLKLCAYHPATEKRVRLLHQLGQTDRCLEELERMLATPYNEEELLFATDFFQRKFQQKRTSLLTDTLRNAETIFIDDGFFRHPEFGVIEHFRQLGFQAFFTENELWHDLFWIFYEKELQQEAHSEFDQGPPSLKEKTFYSLNQERIEERLQNLQTHHVLERVQSYYAKNELALNQALLSFIQYAPLHALKDMLRYMAQDYYQRNSGFPDIMTIQNDQVIFYEVKAEGDVLKSTQLIQMRQLEKSALPVKLLRVIYRYSENQSYVVVDLETTGSLTSYNRITEIGAIKVQGHQIIDTFQTLINPRRSIPPNIQQLTGITNAMVRNAPLFEDIASRFQEFVKDSIFVAHNVGFDYGFLQNEYKRLDERFIRPYICTKAGMKKHYPGLASYSLKSLCELFNISLESHHRALNDAQAASQLLILINQKRQTTL